MLGGYDRGVISLGARRGKERFLQVARRQLRQLFGEIGLRPGRVKRRGVNEGLHLLDDGGSYGRMRVPDAYGQHAAEAVEVLIIGVIPDVHPPAFEEGNRFFIVSGDGGEKELAVLFDNWRIGHKRGFWRDDRGIGRGYFRSISALSLFGFAARKLGYGGCVEGWVLARIGVVSCEL